MVYDVLFEGNKLSLCSSKKLLEICTKRKTKSVKILSFESSDYLLHCIQCVFIYSGYEARSILNAVSAVWRVLWR